MFTVGPAFFGAGDPFASNVLSLLHFDGANGSTTFTDQVPSRSWGASGGSTISTAQSKFGGASLNVPVSSNISLSSPTSAWVMTGDLSVECWMLTNLTGGLAGILSIITSGNALRVGPSSSTAIGITIGGGATRSAGDGAGSIYGRWVHCFFGRQGTTTYVACNGVMTTFTAELTNMSGTISSVTVGSMPAIGGSPYHYIDDLRVTAGVCRYTSSFTPPTSAYPNP